MGYKPKSAASGSFGEWLVGTVVFSASKDKDDQPIPFEKRKVKITQLDTNKEFILSAKNVPNTFEPGTWVIRLSDDKKSVMTYKPYDGLYKGKFVKFASKEGEKPAPKSKHRVGKNKQGDAYEYDYLYFVAVLQITKGRHKGLEVSYELRYNFTELEDEDGVVVVGYKPALEKSIYTQALDEFFEVTGAWEKGRMKWADNLLPYFEKRVLAQDREFSMLFKKGWISTLFSSDEPTEEGSADDDPSFEAENVPDEEE